MSLLSDFCFKHRERFISIEEPWCKLCAEEEMERMSTIGKCSWEEYVINNLVNRPTDPMCCKHKWIVDDGENICKWCGVIEGPEMIKEDLTNLRFDLQYNRSGYFNEVIEHLVGHHYTISLYPIAWIHEVVVEFLSQKTMTWFQIYKRFNHGKIHQCNVPFVYLIPSIMGHPIEFDQRSMKIVTTASTYKKTTNTINILYCIYKAFQMYRKDTSWIPLKSNVLTLGSLDEIWRGICEENKWPYYTSEKSSSLTVDVSTMDKNLMNSLKDCRCEYCSKENHVAKKIKVYNKKGFIIQ